MVCLEQNVLLILDVLYLFLLEEQVLVDALHGVHLAHLAVRDQEHFSKAALVNYFAYLEVFKVDDLTFEARLANQTLARALLLQISLFVEILSGVVFAQVGCLQHNKVVKQLLVHVLPLACRPVCLVHDQGFAAVQQKLGRGHPCDAICQISLCGHVVVQCC